MDASSLLTEVKLHARIDGDHDDAALALMLNAAACDIAHAASYTLPDDISDLPSDLAFAIIDQATQAYDQRGADEGKPGLSLAASRITARYRGVSLGVTDTPDEAETE